MSVPVQCRWLEPTILWLRFPETTASQYNSILWHILWHKAAKLWSKVHLLVYTATATLGHKREGVGFKKKRRKKKRRHTNAVITASIEMLWNSLRTWVFLKGKQMTRKKQYYTITELWTKTQEKEKKRRRKEKNKTANSFSSKECSQKKEKKKPSLLHLEKRTHPLGYIYIKAL